MKKNNKKYEGFSLIEMLFTVVILFIVMLLVASTLNTVIKTSHTANSKNQARSDINYIMNVYDRLLTNSQLEDIKMYNSQAVRRFGFDGNGLPRITGSPGSVYTTPLTVDGSTGNEIHIRLYGHSTWTCIGYFQDNRINPDNPLPYGYIVKSTSTDLTNPEDCFAPTANITLLHSFSNDISKFRMEYIDIGDKQNSMFVVNVTVNPLYWPSHNTYLLKKEVSRLLVVSTKALTRY